MGLKITLSGQTIVKPTALGPVANTDTKLLIYGVISKGPSFGTGRGSSATNVQFTAAANRGGTGSTRRLRELGFDVTASAVGTALTGGPPHRSQRALLTHWAPTSGHDAQSLFGVRVA